MNQQSFVICRIAGLLIDERVVNNTDLTIINKLIPNKTYTVSIAYMNQVGAGPDENIHFRTLELSEYILIQNSGIFFTLYIDSE